jgi:hypothetical protein
LAIVGCGGKASSEARPQTASVTTPAPFLLPGLKVVQARSAATSMTLRLRWNGAAPDADRQPILGLCLPQGVHPRAKWIEARLNGQALSIGPKERHSATSQKAKAKDDATGPAFPSDAGAMQWVGYLRHWPIWKLTASPEAFGPLRRRVAETSRGATEALREADAFALTLQVTWDAPTTATATAPKPATSAFDPDPSPWRAIAQSLIANPGDLDRFAVADPPWPSDLPTGDTDPRRLLPGRQAWARLRVEKEGLCRLDPLELERVGVLTDPARLDAVRVFCHGKPVPLLVAPGEGALPGMPPGVWLWAHGNDGIYSRERVYWVTSAPDAPAARLRSIANPPDLAKAKPRSTIQRTFVRDVDNVLRARHGLYMAFMKMAWVEAALETDKPIRARLAPPLPAPGGGDPRLTLHFFVDRDRPLKSTRVNVSAGADAAPLAGASLDGLEASTRPIAVPASAFRDGATTLTLALSDPFPPSRADEDDDGASRSGIWLDRIELAYASLPRLLEGRLTIDAPAAGGQADWVALPDLNAPSPPSVLALEVDASDEATALWPIGRDASGASGVAFAAPVGSRLELTDVARAVTAPALERANMDALIAPTDPCDLLILTHDAFRPMAERLAAFRRSQGLRVTVADVQSAYDQFGDGEFGPVAIRRLLAHALRRWPKGAPATVLLVGDASCDYLDVARNGVRCWMPSFSYCAAGETFASDYWMTTVTGGDDLGDYMIGRLSVANAQDAQTVVDKIVAYDQSPTPGPWRARMGYVADQGEFGDVVDGIRRDETPVAYSARRVLLDECALEDNWYLAKQKVDAKGMKVSNQATRQIRDAFRAGVSFLSYYGHGSPNIWSTDRIWFGGDSPNSDNLSLADSGHEAFVANMTCNSGAIDYPLTPWNICITEDLMRVKDGGAIACFVPSGPGVTPLHRRMSDSLCKMLYERGLRSLGEIVAAARVDYLLNGNSDDMAYMYLLLGDPTTRLQMTRRRGVFRLDPAAIAPGGKLPLTLTGLTPDSGQWAAELVTRQEKTLWSGGGEGHLYDGGKLTLTVDAPTTAPAGPAILRVYCWPGEGGSPDDDLAAACPVTIQTPCLALGDIVVAPSATGAPGASAGDKLAATIRVANPSILPGQGRLTAWIEDDATSRVLLDREIEGAGEHGVSIAAPKASSGPLTLTARLENRSLPDAPNQPGVETKRALAWPGAAPASWVKSLCSWECSDPASGAATLRATAVLRAELAQELTAKHATLVAELGRPGGAIVANATPSLATLDGKRLDPKPGAAASASNAVPVLARVVFHLNREAVKSLRGGELWLERRSPTPAPAPAHSPAVKPTPASPTPPTPIARLASLKVDDVARLAPSLAIDPASIRVQPPRPVEGDTTWIAFEVVNRGNLMAGDGVVRLLVGASVAAGKPAETSGGGAMASVGDLAPGRSRAMTLRWDPVGNVGKRQLWLSLSRGPAFENPKTQAPAQAVPVTVVALSKPILSIHSSVTTTDLDRRLHRVRINAGVRNAGQSPAHNVMVAFYRGAVQDEANKLGETLLETLAGDQATTVTHVWTYDPSVDLAPGAPLPRPSVKAWLKGSVRPPASDAPPPSR